MPWNFRGARDFKLTFDSFFDSASPDGVPLQEKEGIGYSVWSSSAIKDSYIERRLTQKIDFLKITGQLMKGF